MPRDPAATQARILEAAAAEFAQHGFHGARYDRIAVRARANKERIYAYFGDKEQLFTTVLEQHLGQLAEAHRFTDPPAVVDHIGELFDFHQAHPELTRLLLWEALHFGPDADLPGQDVRAEHYRRRRASLEQLLEGVHGGGPAGHVSFLLSSMVAWWFAVPQVARLHLDGDGGDGQDHERQRQLIIDTAVRLLAPTSATNGSGKTQRKG